jgi:hypothetical protein
MVSETSSMVPVASPPDSSSQDHGGGSSGQQLNRFAAVYIFWAGPHRQGETVKLVGNPRGTAVKSIDDHAGFYHED